MDLGSILRFVRSTGAVSPAALFTGNNGRLPAMPLTPLGDGTYVGTAVSGGSDHAEGTPFSGWGTIYRFDPVAGTVTALANFAGRNLGGATLNGSHPWSSRSSAGGDVCMEPTMVGSDLGEATAMVTHPNSHITLPIPPAAGSRSYSTWVLNRPTPAALTVSCQRVMAARFMHPWVIGVLEASIAIVFRPIRSAKSSASQALTASTPSHSPMAAMAFSRDQLQAEVAPTAA